MAEIRANLKKMSETIDSMIAEDRKLGILQQNLGQLSGGLGAVMSGDEAEKLRLALNKQCEAVEEERAKLKEMIRALESIYGNYTKCEQGLEDTAEASDTVPKLFAVKVPTVNDLTLVKNRIDVLFGISKT